MEYKEIEGDLIELAKQGMFDVIAHGCNCLCTMGAGIAPQMAREFGCDAFSLESAKHKGDINKLGQVDYMGFNIVEDGKDRVSIFYKTNPELYVVNAYTQYKYGRNHSNGVSKPLDYEALTLCFRKMNHVFKGKHIGLPWIGCGLAGGSKSIVRKLIKAELADCKVTVVTYNK